MQFLLTVPAVIQPCDCFFFERGPESIIRRLQVKDIQGRLLEDLAISISTTVCMPSPKFVRLILRVGNTDPRSI